MIDACHDSAVAYAETYVGKTVPVLLETANSDKTVDGHTDTYLTVRLSTRRQSGDMVTARIVACDGERLIGEETD